MFCLSFTYYTLSIARQLSCTFSTDGGVDNDSSPPPALDLSNQDEEYQEDSELPTRQSTRPPKATGSHQLNKQHQLLETTIKALDFLGDHWIIDEEQLIERPPSSNDKHQLLSAHASNARDLYHRLTLPPRKTQRQLILLYYQHKYPLFHMIPQDLFLQQLDLQDLAISPLLLVTMLAHAAQINSTDDGKEADNYFKQAKGLLDSLLDTPSLSLVVALCLMSLYEPKHGVDYRSSALCYSAMASRMYNQLCHTRQFDESRRSYDDGDDNGRFELWKRVAWGCYCLDKLQGVCFGASWMLRLDGMMVDLPRYFWPNEDQEQLECFVAFIKLTQMAEQSLCPDDFWRQPVTKDYSNALQLDQVLLQWLQALPVHFQWTPLPTTSNAPSSLATVPKDPPRNPWIAQLHLVFNMIELRILTPFASPSTNTNSLLQQRCVSVATCLTQLTHYMVDQPASILSYAFTGTATMMAIRVHLMNCSSYQDRHTRDMFHRGMQSLSSLVMQGNRTIPGVDTFLDRVKGALHIGGDPEPTLPTGSLLSENSNAATKIDHMYLTGSEQNAAEVLSHAFGTASTFSSPPLWQHQHPAPVDPLDFLESTAVNDIWNHPQRMAPSSVDALLNKSRFLVDDHRLQDFSNGGGGGGLVMSHSKLNDPLLLSTWMMRHTKDLATDSAGPENSPSQDSLHPIPTDITFMTPSTAPHNSNSNNNSSNSLFWAPSTSTLPLPPTTPSSSYVPNKPVAVTTPAATTLPTRSFGQYMNIGLGVYASAHQHHNDVIRQHIPGVAAASGSGGGGNNARPVLLTHQGQVIVAPSGTFGPSASSDTSHGGANAM